MKKKKVLIAGTFDLIHPGHIFLINKAAKLGEVHVIVATDKNRKIYSGEKPIINELQRLEVVKHLKNVKSARLGRRDNNTLKTVQEINPDIILLGPNQKYSIEELKQGLNAMGLGHIEVKRLERYYDAYEFTSSTKIKKKIIEEYKKGNIRV
ncbi:MAG: adenylyltransferase/cytidyltransferase family protein [Promethearchaeota archaeon]